MLLGTFVCKCWADRSFIRGAGSLVVKKSTCQRRRCNFHPWLGEDPLEKETATQSSILAWESPWTEEPVGLQFTGLQRVKHDLATEH